MKKIVKNFLITKMEHHFSPFISAYHKSFSTEHVLIRLIEDRRNELGNNVAVAVLTDLPKAFDYIPHDLLVAKHDATEILSYLKAVEAVCWNKWYSKLFCRYHVRCPRPYFI